jgi:regulator of replication initiation timing
LAATLHSVSIPSDNFDALAVKPLREPQSLGQTVPPEPELKKEPPQPPSRQADKEAAEDYARDITKLIEAGDWENPALAEKVDFLKSKRHMVPPLCGGAWNEWSAPGTCQVCSIAVDRKEKGLHCSNGGHRLCWPCMVQHVKWSDVNDAGFAKMKEAKEREIADDLQRWKNEVQKVQEENARNTKAWNELKERITRDNAARLEQIKKDHAEATRAIQDQCRRWQEAYQAGYHEASELFAQWLMALINAVPSSSDVVGGIIPLPVTASSLKPALVPQVFQRLLDLNAKREEVWDDFDRKLEQWGDIPEVFNSRPDLASSKDEKNTGVEAVRQLEKETPEMTAKIAKVHPVNREPYQSATDALATEWESKLKQYEEWSKQPQSYLSQSHPSCGA